MFDVVLYQPEIPPNTGNALRLCANTGCRLHLVKPLGFLLTDRALARAGLDYDDIRSAVLHDDWDAALARLAGRRLFAFSSHAVHSYADARFAPTTCSSSAPKPAASRTASWSESRRRSACACRWSRAAAA